MNLQTLPLMAVNENVLLPDGKAGGAADTPRLSSFSWRTAL